jgi:tRNA (guanine26-N2/guanine27-N2)-dimethyltransferase
MRTCRDVSVLAIRASLAGMGVRAVDATAGSGIRPIRYAKECAGAVGELFLVDANPSAVRSARANLRRNGVRAKAVASTFARFANSANAKGGFGLVELDPFGSPVPFLHDAIRVSRGGTLLSVTATDTAVLCGAHPRACLKNYHAKPLNTWCCHETGARILAGKIAREASEFNLGIAPVATLSHKHYFKTILFLEPGAERAVASIRQTGFCAHCNKCLHTVHAKGTANPLPGQCPRCGQGMEFAGPMWLGELQSKKALGRMRACEPPGEAGRLVEAMWREAGMPPFHFELHKIAKKLGVSAVSPARVETRLVEKGFLASPTHFQRNSLKTDAGIGDVEAAIAETAAQQI